MEAVFTVSSLLYFHWNVRGFVGAAMTVAEWSPQQAETTTYIYEKLFTKNTISELGIISIGSSFLGWRITRFGKEVFIYIYEKVLSKT